MEENKKSTVATKIIILLSVVIAVISAYILIFVELPGKKSLEQGKASTTEASVGGKFALTDQNGTKFSSDRMNGYLSLVYFGFTYCPDVCLTTLNKLSNVINALEKYKIEVLPIFITVDPERDSPEVLKKYLGYFHSKFIGLTGSPAEIKQVAELYKVFYARSSPSETNNSR